jgi:hypothetical protein
MQVISKLTQQAFNDIVAMCSKLPCTKLATIADVY